MPLSNRYTLKEIKLELTYRCLLRCIHCSSEACSDSTAEMSYTDADRIISQAIAMGVQHIAFSGGDPLLWPNLRRLIHNCTEAELPATVYTSGVVPNSKTIIKNLADSGLHRIIFSLYAATPATHDAVTMVGESHQQTIEAIRHSKSLGLKTELHFVPMVANYLELPKLASLAGQLGIEQLSILRLVPQGRSKGVDGIVLSQKQTKALSQLIIDAKKYVEIRIGSPYSILLCSQSPKCMAGIDRLTVAPDLTISPCDAFKQVKSMDVVGTDAYSTLAKWSLRECWQNSPYLNSVREYIAAPLHLPCSKCRDVNQCCSGCTAQKYITHGQLLKAPDPLCLRMKTYSLHNGK